MARNYEVLLPKNKEWMFIDPNCYYAPGYISYRHVISYALHAILHNGILDISDVPSLVTLLKSHWDKKLDYDDGFSLALRVSSTSVTVSDHTKGCYPLILEGERIGAFQHAIDDIDLHIKVILDLLVKYPTWCIELQNELNDVYHLPRRH